MTGVSREIFFYPEKQISWNIFQLTTVYISNLGTYLYPAALLRPRHTSSFAVRGFMHVLTIDIIMRHVCGACGLDTRERKRAHSSQKLREPD